MKKLLPDLIAILAFVLLSFAYFFPADIENRILFQHDTAAGAGAGQEVKEYYEQTGERSRWTNSLFGGMPMYQIAPSYDSTKSLQWVQKAYQLFLPDYVCLTFMLMLGFYILLRVFGIPVWLAGLGGIMWAFSSYFFILISAGHIWKFITLAYVPPTIAGIANHLEPRADVLLLLLRHPFLCGSLLRESMAYQDIAPVLQGKCRTDCSSPRRHSRQRIQPLSHLCLQQRNHARQERTGADRRRCQADQ